jgi:Sulfotransferase family
LEAAHAAQTSRSTASPCGVFIVGHARSGTTILQNALNDSPDIFVFGEAQFYRNSSTGFAARYNAMHRYFCNQITKSTYCPPVVPDDGNWKNYVDELSKVYRHVGDKVCFGPQASGYSCDDFFEFQCLHFLRPLYLFTFRNPVDCIASSMALLGDKEMYVWMVSYLNVFLLCIKMLRIFPHVQVLFCEDTSQRTFDELGTVLDCDLSNSFSYYNVDRMTRYTPDLTSANAAAMMDSLEEIYARWRSMRVENRLPQIEQKEGTEKNRSPSYLGRMHNTIVDTITRFAPAALADVRPAEACSGRE